MGLRKDALVFPSVDLSSRLYTNVLLFSLIQHTEQLPGVSYSIRRFLVSQNRSPSAHSNVTLTEVLSKSPLSTSSITWPRQIISQPCTQGTCCKSSLCLPCQPHLVAPFSPFLARQSTGRKRHISWCCDRCSWITFSRQP